MALINQQVKQAFLRVADFLIPPTCPVCADIVGQPGGLCADCWAQMPRLQGKPCVSCGLPAFKEAHGPASCDCLHLPQVYDQRRAVWDYEGHARKLILRLKHGDRPDIAPALARLLRAELRGIERECDLIMPVPAHWQRFLARRYNQAELLAQNLSSEIGKPLDLGLVRIKATPSQSGGRFKRAKNVRDAFAVKSDVTGKTILLVDDVMTTGATLNACAAQLKDAGAASVHYVVLAAVPPFRGHKQAKSESDNQRP